MPAGKLTLAVAGSDPRTAMKYTRGKPRWRSTRSGNTSRKRAQGRSRNTRWFKRVIGLRSDADGKMFETIRAHDLTQLIPAANPMAEAFEKYAAFYSMYRCTKIVVKFIPRSVTSASLQDTTGRPMFQFGDVVTWVNQDDSVQAAPTAGINDVIGKGSAKLRNPTKVIKIWAGRPKNFPIWGDVDGTLSAPIFLNTDPWNPSLCFYGDNFTPVNVAGSQIFYWIEVFYKVEFKGQKY